jgi:P-type conjugative transfer protein TrbL
MMSDVQSAFQGQLSTIGGAMNTAAKGIFWSLATISFVWSMAQLAMKAADLGEILTELIRFTVVTGVFWFILQNGSTIGLAIAQSFDQLAAAAGAGGVSTPDGVLNAAGSIWSKSLLTLNAYVQSGQVICSQAGANDGVNFAAAIGDVGACELNLSIGLVFMLVSFLATYLVLVIVAIDMLILRVTLYLVIYLGLITLGFGGLRQTEDMAIGYLKTVGSTAIANMTMAIIAFLGLSFVRTQTIAMTAAIAAALNAMTGQSGVSPASIPLSACMEGLIAALVVLFLIKRVPHILGQMIGGVNPASQVSGAGAALVGAGVAGTGLLGGAMVAAGAKAAADKASKGVKATMAGANGGGDTPAAGGPDSPGGGGTGPSPVEPLDGASSTGAPRSASAGPSDFARKSGDTIPPARPVDLGGPNSGVPDGQASRTMGGAESADTLSADKGGPRSGATMGAAGEPAAAAQSAGGVQDGPGGGPGKPGAASRLAAAGEALKLAAGATGAVLAVHDGVEPLTAARSAYRGGRPGRRGSSQDQGIGGLAGGVISGGEDSVDS